MKRSKYIFSALLISGGVVYLTISNGKTSGLKESIYAGYDYFTPKPGWFQNADSDTTMQKVEGLIQKKLVDKLRAVHDPNSNVFSRAYVGETYRHDIYEIPDANRQYYQGTLMEFKAQFMTNKMEFRVYLDKGEIMMEDKDAKKYISVDQWVEKFKK